MLGVWFPWRALSSLSAFVPLSRYWLLAISDYEWAESWVKVKCASEVCPPLVSPSKFSACPFKFWGNDGALVNGQWWMIAGLLSKGWAEHVKQRGSGASGHSQRQSHNPHFAIRRMRSHSQWIIRISSVCISSCISISISNKSLGPAPRLFAPLRRL